MSTRTENATHSRPDLSALTGLLCAVVYIGGLVVTDALIPASGITGVTLDVAGGKVVHDYR